MRGRGSKGLKSLHFGSPLASLLFAQNAVSPDGTAAHEKPTATSQMRKVNYGRFLVRYEDDGVEEWLGLPGDAFNNNARGSWRVDQDFEATGGIEGAL